jgi:hypothetical protein
MKQIIFMALLLCSCLRMQAQEDSAEAKPKQGKAYNYKGAESNKYFPFIVVMTSVEYDITINLDDPKVVAKYKRIFDKHEMPFTPDGWEELISGLYNNDSEMHHQIITSAQNNVLRIGTGGEEYQKAFLKYMMPLISNTQKLDSFLKNEDE